MATGGFGRGGRGSALYQALQTKMRKPGESSPPKTESTHQPNVPEPERGIQAPIKPFGRGNLSGRLQARPPVVGEGPQQGAVPQPSTPPRLGRGLTRFDLQTRPSSQDEQARRQSSQPSVDPHQRAYPQPPGQSQPSRYPSTQQDQQPPAQQAYRAPSVQPFGRGAPIQQSNRGVSEAQYGREAQVQQQSYRGASEAQYGRGDSSQQPQRGTSESQYGRESPEQQQPYRGAPVSQSVREPHAQQPYRGAQGPQSGQEPQGQQPYRGAPVPQSFREPQPAPQQPYRGAPAPQSYQDPQQSYRGASSAQYAGQAVPDSRSSSRGGDDARSSGTASESARPRQSGMEQAQAERARAPPMAPQGGGATAAGAGVEQVSREMQRLHMPEEGPPIMMHGTDGKTMNLCVNYIPVRCRTECFYQYAVSFSPMVDSKNIRYKMVKEQTPIIGEVQVFDGFILFLPIKLQEKETICHSVRRSDGQEITIRIKYVKNLRPGQAIPVLNLLFRRVMNALKMVQVARHNFNPNSPVSIPQHKLEVWPGYITSCMEYEGGLMLLADVAHKVLRTETVLQVMQNLHHRNRGNFNEECCRLLVGSSILTRYNNKYYRIDDILWDQNPLSTFETGSGQAISYKEYYQKNYNITIRDEGQPLLVNRPKKREQGASRVEFLCLIPELSFMTGLTDEMRANFTVMKDLAAHTRVSPMQRQTAMKKFTHNVSQNPEASKILSDWGLELDMELLRIKGRQFPPEPIIYGNKKMAGNPQADWGRDMTKNKVITAVSLRRWLVVYHNRNRNQAENFIKTVKHVGPQMGIDVSEAIPIELPNDRTETYLQTIRSHLNPEVQIVVIIFPTSRDDRYNAVKKLCCIDAPVPSQVIISKTIGNQQKLVSVCQKIVLQMNCKLGGELWALSIPLGGLMVCGIDAYHDAAKNHRSVGAFVSSTNKTLTRWFSRAFYQMQNQEIADKLKMCMTQAIKKWCDVNHGRPDRIIVYRDGVGDNQLDIVSDYEVRQMSEAFQLFGEDYDPKLSVVVVGKRINTRIFEVQRGQRGESLANPYPGTIVDHTINRRNMYDFFLISQHVRQGTVSPTHYMVVHDGNNLPVDRMQKLAYKMTHLYYNWPGTIRVPAPCQYANRLAQLTGQNLHKEPHAALSDRLFFL